MKRLATAIAAVALGGLVIVGCEGEVETTASRTGTASTAPAVDVDVNTDKLEGSAERAGNAIERAGDRAVDAAKEAGRDTREALSAAGRKVDNAVDVDVNTNRDNAQQAGARTGAAPDAEGIRDVLAQAAEAALTKGGLDDLVERLVDQDRNRLGQNNALDQNLTELDGRIEQFQNDWKAKYGQAFGIENEAQAFPATTFMIRQGELGRNAAGVDVDVDRNAAGGKTATVDVDRKSGVDAPDSAAADANRNDPGRNVASVQIQQSHGMPALTVPMIHEAPDSWRIDVPNTLTAEKLKANVLAHLTAANQMKDQWPADVNQAQAMVTHHVLMALMDKPVQQQ